MKQFIGVIGGGYWGKNLIRDFHNLGVLHSVCEINEDVVKQYQLLYKGVQFTNDYNELLTNTDITAVCIALPAVLHFQYAREALLMGKDVYVEKPLALKVEHCEELIKIAEEKNRILMVGHLLQYHPCVKKIYELISMDYIGKIRYIVSNRLNLGKIRKEENVLWSFAPHDISIILKLMGDELPISVECDGKSFISPNVHDITSTILDFGDTYCQINVNWLNPYKEQKLIIVGTKGMFIFDDRQPHPNKLTYYSEYLKWDKGVPVAQKSDGQTVIYDSTNSPLILECKHFVNCCLKRKTPLTDGHEGLRVLKVLDMAEKSLLQGGNKLFSSSMELSEEKFKQQLKEKDIFVHETGVVDKGAEIGENSKIWHFSHIMSGCKIGERCNIGQNVFIGKGVILGNECKVQNNVSIYDGVECGDNVFFGPSCVLTNDKNPRCEFSKNGQYIKTIIEDGVTIGANSTIVCGVTLGKYSMIGAGAVVTKDVEPYTLVVGNPARVLKKINREGDL